MCRAPRRRSGGRRNTLFGWRCLIRYSIIVYPTMPMHLLSAPQSLVREVTDKGSSYHGEREMVGCGRTLK